MTKYLFFDADGTLIDRSLKIPAGVCEALKQAQKNGHKIILCTGRKPGDIKPFRAIGMDAYICANGAYIETGAEKREKPLSDEQAERLITLAEKYHCSAALMGYDDGWSDEKNIQAVRKLVINFLKTDEEETITPWIALLNGLPYETRNHAAVYKADIIFDEETDAEGFVSALGSDLLFTPVLSTIANSKSGGELTAAGVTKGNAVREVLEYFHGDTSDSIGFGDSLNDLTMLEECGTAVAMGNGMDELKKYADYVTGDIHEDGIINALKHYGLI